LVRTHRKYAIEKGVKSERGFVNFQKRFFYKLSVLSLPKKDVFLRYWMTETYLILEVMLQKPTSSKFSGFIVNFPALISLF